MDGRVTDMAPGIWVSSDYCWPSHTHPRKYHWAICCCVILLIKIDRITIANWLRHRDCIIGHTRFVRLFKFRSMQEDADTTGHKVANLARKTRSAIGSLCAMDCSGLDVKTAKLAWDEVLMKHYPDGSDPDEVVRLLYAITEDPGMDNCGLGGLTRPFQTELIYRCKERLGDMRPESNDIDYYSIWSSDLDQDMYSDENGCADDEQVHGPQEGVICVSNTNCIVSGEMHVLEDVAEVANMPSPIYCLISNQPMATVPKDNDDAAHITQCDTPAMGMPVTGVDSAILPRHMPPPSEPVILGSDKLVNLSSPMGGSHSDVRSWGINPESIALIFRIKQEIRDVKVIESMRAYGWDGARLRPPCHISIPSHAAPPPPSHPVPHSTHIIASVKYHNICSSS